jgi:hypothetical protein
MFMHTALLANYEKQLYHNFIRMFTAKSGEINKFEHNPYYCMLFLLEFVFIFAD